MIVAPATPMGVPRRVGAPPTSVDATESPRSRILGVPGPRRASRRCRFLTNLRWAAGVASPAVSLRVASPLAASAGGGEEDEEDEGGGDGGDEDERLAGGEGAAADGQFEER